MFDMHSFVSYVVPLSWYLSDTQNKKLVLSFAFHELDHHYYLWCFFPPLPPTHVPPKQLAQGPALTTASIVQPWLDGKRKPQAHVQQSSAPSASSGIWAMDKKMRKATWANWEAAITAEAAKRVARKVISHDIPRASCLSSSCRMTFSACAGRASSGVPPRGRLYTTWC